MEIHRTSCEQFGIYSIVTTTQPCSDAPCESYDRTASSHTRATRDIDIKIGTSPSVSQKDSRTGSHFGGPELNIRKAEPIFPSGGEV